MWAIQTHLTQCRWRDVMRILISFFCANGDIDRKANVSGQFQTFPPQSDIGRATTTPNYSYDCSWWIKPVFRPPPNRQDSSQVERPHWSAAEEDNPITSFNTRLEIYPIWNNITSQTIGRLNRQSNSNAIEGRTKKCIYCSRTNLVDPSPQSLIVRCTFLLTDLFDQLHSALIEFLLEE
jgi:hypothetical protein